MAQATIYGVIDQAYNQQKPPLVQQQPNKQLLLNSTWNGSLVGFKAVEDLGGGMKAFGQYEMGVNDRRPN
jgi:predicted porin